MKKKILIVGSSKKTGYFLSKILKKKYHLSLWSSKGMLKNLNKHNLKKKVKLEEIKKFSVIIYCSAISNFTDSKKYLSLSKLININLIRLIIYSMQSNQKLIYFSSYGVKSKFPNITPIYIKQKIKIENVIKKKLKNYFILRPTKIINTLDVISKNNLLKNFIFYTDKKIHVTSYQIIYKTIIKIISKNLVGTVNIGSKNKISMSDIAKVLLKNKKNIKFGISDNNYKYKLIEPKKIYQSKKFRFIYKKAKLVLKDYRIY